MYQLSQLRIEAGLTQTQLAEEVGVSSRTVQFWESGLVRPSFETLQRLVQVLGPSVLDAFSKEAGRKRGRPRRDVSKD
jgi:transcriptional regulator with XRE-family HTH domain